MLGCNTHTFPTSPNEIARAMDYLSSQYSPSVQAMAGFLLYKAHNIMEVTNALAPRMTNELDALYRLKLNA